MRIAVLTISDAGSRGERKDTSGDAIVAWAEARGDQVVVRDLVPDDTVEITRLLIVWADRGDADLILTTGGTGLSPRDVTPEATRAVIEREAPGIANRIRREGEKSTPNAALSRGLAGTRNRTLIINLPGSTSGVKDSLAAIEPIVDHAVKVMRGETPDHAPYAEG